MNCLKTAGRNDPQRNLAFGDKEVNSKLVGKVWDVEPADVQNKNASERPKLLDV